jgi:putative nucleotidyltransferase with HDIG domain
MDQDELTSLKLWFAEYCASFATPVTEDQKNLDVKQDHTREVCRHAVRIATDLKLSGHDVLLAEAIGLFHDVGRFPQYQRFKTFDDSISVNHAALGAKVLLEKNVLRALPKPEQDLIIRSVSLHNVFSLPESLDERTLLFAKLVRDSDKLDILRVVIEYFQQDEGSRAEAVALGLPDAPEYSPEVLACLKRGEMVSKADLKTLNDFKLLQLAWLYDLNFTSSLRVVLERGDIGKLVSMLPPTAEIAEAADLVRAFVDRRLRAGAG